MFLQAIVSAQSSESTIELEMPYVGDMAWSPDGDLIAVKHADRILIYSDSLETQDQIQLDWDSYPGSLSWSPDSTRLASTANGSILIWARRRDNSFQLETALSLKGFQQILVSWSPDGTRIASQDFPIIEIGGSEELDLGESRVNLWNTTTWKLEQRLAQRYSYGNAAPTPTFPFALEWSSDGNLLAGTSGVHEMWMMNVANGQALPPMQTVEPVTALDWHPNGLIAFGAGVSTSIYSVMEQRALYSWWDNGAIRDLAWSPDGTKLLYFSENEGTVIRDFSTGIRLATLSGSLMRWSPDGTRIAGVLGNPERSVTELRIWDVRDLPDVSGIPTLTPYPS